MIAAGIFRLFLKRKTKGFKKASRQAAVQQTVMKHKTRLKGYRRESQKT